MTKRFNPFNGNCCPQIKKYIRECDVYNTVSQQSVYDKTKELLFRGSNNVRRFHLNGNISHKEVEVAQFEEGSLKQTFLSNDCQIRKTGVLKVPAKKCCSNSGNVCTFCEKQTCIICLVICCRCGEVYCSSCSLNIYDQDEETQVCLSCL